jgi:hypothetical protein
MKRLGPVEGEAMIREAVESFGRERGRRIAERVKAMGLPLSFKNWLIYTDIDNSNFGYRPHIDTHDLLARVKECSFISAAREWGLEEYACLYCRYADHPSWTATTRHTAEARGPLLHRQGPLPLPLIMKEGNK